MRIFEAIVKGLESLGVDTAFGGTGENNASLLLALKASKKINTVIVRHEQAASFMACGYAMYSNRLGVCFATAGPGAFNLFSGMAVALTDSLPVLAISGYSSLDWKGKGALNETTGLNRMPDSQAMFAATTKRTFLVEDVSQTCDILEKAVNIAFEGCPGPGSHPHPHQPDGPQCQSRKLSRSSPLTSSACCRIPTRSQRPPMRSPRHLARRSESS